MLKELLGVDEDGQLNISSTNLTRLMSQLRWLPKTTIAPCYLINYCIVEYGDANVWYLIARYNDYHDGIAPANSTMFIPSRQSLTTMLSIMTNETTTSSLGSEVMI